MNRTRVTVTAVITAAVLLTTAGCSNPSNGDLRQGTIEGRYQVIIVDINGRAVPCVVYDGFQAGGITCDWTAP